MRDDATVEQLLVLANLEALSAELIRLGWEPNERMTYLAKIAREQLTTLERTKAATRMIKSVSDEMNPPAQLSIDEG